MRESLFLQEKEKEKEKEENWTSHCLREGLPLDMDSKYGIFDSDEEDQPLGITSFFPVIKRLRQQPVQNKTEAVVSPIEPLLVPSRACTSFSPREEARDKDQREDQIHCIDLDSDEDKIGILERELDGDDPVCIDQVLPLPREGTLVGCLEKKPTLGFTDSDSDDSDLGRPLSERLGLTTNVAPKRVDSKKQPDAKSVPNEEESLNLGFIRNKTDENLSTKSSLAAKKTTVSGVISEKRGGKRVEGQRKGQEKEKREKERDAKRCEKEAEKKRKEIEREVLKHQSLKESLNYCTAIIDCNIFKKICLKSEVELVFNENKGRFKETLNPSVANSIVWLRNTMRVVEEEEAEMPNSQMSVNHEESYENQLLLVVPKESAVKMVNKFKEQVEERIPNEDSPSLFNFVENVSRSAPNKEITLLFMGLDSYYKSEKSKEVRQFQTAINGSQAPKKAAKGSSELPAGVKKLDVDQAIIDLELRSNEIKNCLGVHVVFVDSVSELANLIVTYTKAVAAAPFKRKRNNQHGFEWFAEGDKGYTVDIKEDRDLTKLWKYQLEQFPKISRDIAESIVRTYPSLVSLLSRYTTLSQYEAEHLLENISICRLNGPQTTRERRVGPEISKRVYLFCTTRDEKLLLNSASS